MTEISNGLKRNYSLNIVSFQGILEDTQRKFANELRNNRIERLNKAIKTDESWAQTKVMEVEQKLVDFISGCDVGSVEEI